MDARYPLLFIDFTEDGCPQSAPPEIAVASLQHAPEGIDTWVAETSDPGAIVRSMTDRFGPTAFFYAEDPDRTAHSMEKLLEDSGPSGDFNCRILHFSAALAPFFPGKSWPAETAKFQSTLTKVPPDPAARAERLARLIGWIIADPP